MQVADTLIIVSRDTDGSIHAWLNRCAHRNAKICLNKPGHTDSFYCVYHQWTYDLTGRLIAVPFSSAASAARAACRPTST